MMKKFEPKKNSIQHQRIKASKMIPFIIYGICGLVIISVFFIYLSTNHLGVDAIVAHIDNEPVSVREFRRQLIQKRGEVIAYFRMKYGVEVGAGFWTRSYQGEIPAEIVKKQALLEVSKIKEQLILAKKAGLIDDIRYKTILKNMKLENKKRQAAIAKNQKVYGLMEFNEQTYLYYLMSDIAKNLKILLAEKWNITDQELQNYYQKVKDIYYVEGRRVKVKEIKLSYMEKDGSINEVKRNFQLEKITEAKEQLRSSESFETIARKYNNSITKEHIFDMQTAKYDANFYPKLRNYVMGMKPGDVSEIIEDGNAFYIVKCIENISLSYTPYEKVKEYLRPRYIDLKYDEFITKLANEAEVQINQAVYRKITTDQ